MLHKINSENQKAEQRKTVTLFLVQVKNLSRELLHEIDYEKQGSKGKQLQYSL